MISYIKIIIFVFTTLAPALSKGQSKFGIRTGLNINKIAFKNIPDQYTGDFGESKPIVGFHIAGFYTVKLSDRFLLRPEIQLVQKGTSLEYSFGETTIRNSYLEVNILGSYNILTKINLDFGPYFGYMVSSSHAGIDYNKIDFGLLSGIGVKISEKIGVIARYCYGLTSVDEISFRDPNNIEIAIIKEYNRNAQISLYVML
ncbi:MAG: PorT family protein [Cyclobacteriaceae bacterium]|nr:PorT family protein [Cyclobacteriaceae bacterium]